MPFNMSWRASLLAARFSTDSQRPQMQVPAEKANNRNMERVRCKPVKYQRIYMQNYQVVIEPKAENSLPASRYLVHRLHSLRRAGCGV